MAVIIAIVAQAVLACLLCALECRVLLSCVRLNARGDLQVRDEPVDKKGAPVDKIEGGKLLARGEVPLTADVLLSQVYISLLHIYL